MDIKFIVYYETIYGESGDLNIHDNVRNARVQIVKAILDEFPDLRQWVKEYLKEYLKSVEGVS